MSDKCDHEEIEWVEQDNESLGCLDCNGTLQIDTWKCLECGKTATSEKICHMPGEPCNPLKWDDPASE